MEKIIPLDDFPYASLLYGNYNCNVKLLRRTFNVDIIARDRMTIQGRPEDVEKTCRVVSAIQDYIVRHKSVSASQVEDIVADFALADRPEKDGGEDESFPVRPRTEGQRQFMRAIREYELVFAIGPAGTGKTYLAVAMAVDALKKGLVRKIVLVRPAVEAGEKLGFLPGDYEAKINPYLRPLYDALYDLMQFERLKKGLHKNIIEVAPLAYMRGRTLESAFIILDEAQNTTVTQMKMFLTRLGFNSKIVVTGDITQIDLPVQVNSGLLNAQSILRDLSGVKFFYFSSKDIVRHPLVQKIVDAYETSEERERAAAAGQQKK